MEANRLSQSCPDIQIWYRDGQNCQASPNVLQSG